MPSSGLTPKESIQLENLMLNGNGTAELPPLYKKQREAYRHMTDPKIRYGNV